jgi:hypothetical protein
MQEMSMLRPRVPLLRLLCLFQSHRQALSWFSTLAATLSIIYVVTYAFELKRMPLDMLAISVLIGASFSLIFALPFEFSVRVRDNNMTFALHEVITGAGYQLDRIGSSGVPGEVRFIQTGPNWLRWRESDVVLKSDLDWLRVSGPLLVLWRLRNKTAQHIG